MIERFNFYDVYGNLLPGIAFLALLWLPFGIARDLWPPTALSSAVAASAFAYMFGHILQSFATNAFPSKAKDSRGKRRYPSNFFLDPGQSSFSQRFKEQLAQAVEESFHLDLAINAYGGEGEEVDRARRAAFFLCRGFLVREKIGSYAEQFEGLYALMRGLTVSFWLTAPYFFGWAASVWPNHCFNELTRFGVFAGLFMAIASSTILVFSNARSNYPLILDLVTFVSLITFFFCFGVVCGASQPLATGSAKLLAAIALGTLIGGLRCFRAYKYYAEQFARAIWQDFAGQRMLTRSGDGTPHQQQR